MDKKQTNNSQLGRDRVVYDYLESLDRGDIDGIIDSLQQALYDPSLDQMIIEAHQSYFQEEPAVPAALIEQDTQQMPTIDPIVRLPRGASRRQKKNKRVRYIARWVQVLAAVLVIGILVGSFITIQSLHNQSAKNISPGKTPQAQVCQPYPLKQFDAQNNIPTAFSLNSLTSITTISESDAWAVGSSHSSPTTTGLILKNTFIEHWDGKSWRFVHSPNGSSNSQLTGVAAVSTNDVWAVGYSLPDYVDETSKTLIEHWDGKTWQVVPSPNGAGDHGLLNSVTVISAHNIWAVGTFFDASSAQNNHPLLEHWDGTSWHVVSPPEVDTSIIGTLKDVTATSANDIWAVGSLFTTNDERPHGLMMHWDGHRWTTDTLPTTERITSISAHSVNDIWAEEVDLNSNPLIEHWDGQKWNDLAVPSQYLRSSTAINLTTWLSISVVSDNDIWAVGNTGRNGLEDQTLILHWNGKSWQHVPSPTLQSFNSTTTNDISKAAAYGGQLWILVNANDNASEGGYTMSLILGQRTCP